jgi:NAD(P)H-nitrite reductase large subunit
MQLDDEVCLCFHVTKRKLVNFLRIEKPRRAAQMSECFGAGTGCGWCRRYLTKMFDAAQPGAAPADDPDATEYAKQRSAYVKAGGGTPPPGATPVE